MDKLDEKCRIYEQMKLIIEERRELTKAYFALKERLNELDCTSKFNQEIHSSQKQQRDQLKREHELQSYYANRNEADKHHRSYQDYGVTIASILKEAGKPLSNKQLYETLIASAEIYPTYQNFAHNILPQIQKDDGINVERAMRGYWQYRLAK